MGISEFIQVLQNFPGISGQEAENVLALKQNYPFSQVLHALAARVSKDQGFNNSSAQLQLAAVYAADRGLLKSLMESQEPTEYPRSEVVVLTKPVETGKVDYAEELIHDLEKLNELRSNFELLFVDGSSTSFTHSIAEPEINEKPTDKAESNKSKKERIIELAKSVSNEPSAVILDQKASKRRRKDSAESLIDQIVVSKEELTPESEKQKEQLELIDHFIKAQPIISGSKDKHIAAEDLTSIKTGDFNDSIISETLVEILLKQGKKEKAIEVLKKLIWKFPQKKAYFASQIEELKK